MKLWKVLVAVAPIGLATANPVEATTLVNFNTQSGSSFTNYRESGDTSNPAADAGAVLSDTTPNGTLGLVSIGSGLPLLRGDVAAGASSAGITQGDFGQDAGGRPLRSGGSVEALLNRATVATLAAENSIGTLSDMTASSIAFALVGPEAPSIGGGSVLESNSLNADNLGVTAVGAAAAAAITSVPEPATMTLFSFGIAGIAARRWRGRKTGQD